MICHKCGKVVLWERMIVDKGDEKRIYHIQCWDRDEEKDKIHKLLEKKNPLIAYWLRNEELEN